jgi:hypothetical protein
VSITLARIEEIIDGSGVALRAGALLPTGVRRRQLRVRTLLAGMLLSQAAQRPAHLTRIRDALTALPEPDQVRPGVLADWKTGPHPLTCRQTGDVSPGRRGPGQGRTRRPAPRYPHRDLQRPAGGQHPRPVQAGLHLAGGGGDRRGNLPPPRGSTDCAGPEASWGHRSGGGPGQDSELFFGYHPSAATMMRGEHGPAVPELARRMTVCSCHADPARALVPVLTRMPGQGIPLGHPGRLPIRPPRRRGLGHPAPPGRAQLVQDLHPSGRGPRGTHDGAIIANGNLYCPATPRPLLELTPLARDATPEQTAEHDMQAAELARHKLGKITADGADGHRVMCPAAIGKIRCPLRPASMTLDRDRPEILTPPRHPPACCSQQTITVPPDVAAKTRQKHDYPSREHRKSYARRTGAERTFATTKDPASNNITRGWCRLMGLTPLMLWLACLLAVRNQRILAAWDARQAETARRAAAGLPPKTRKRRRRQTPATLADVPP